jgi:PTS system nitrogen regulatory IIA component
LGVFQQVVTSLPGVTPPIRQLLIQRILAQGGVAFAPIGGGFAMPHLSTRVSLGRDSGTIALLLLQDALTLAEPTPDGIPITRLLFFVAPSPRAHLDLLGRLCRLLTRGSLREAILHGAPDEDIFREIAVADQQVPGGSGGGEAT